MTHPNGSDVIVVEDVLVVRRMEFGWQCEIAGEPVFVSTLQIAPDFLMPADGLRVPIKFRAGALDDIAENMRSTGQTPATFSESRPRSSEHDLARSDLAGHTDPLRSAVAGHAKS